MVKALEQAYKDLLDAGYSQASTRQWLLGHYPPARVEALLAKKPAKDSSAHRARLHKALDKVLDRSAVRDDWYGSSTEGERLIDAAVELRKKKPALVLKLRGKLSKEERAKAEAEYDALENAVRSKVREARNAGYKGPWT